MANEHRFRRLETREELPRSTDTSDLLHLLLNIYCCFRAQLRTKEDGEGQHAFLKADGQYDLDTIAKGDLKTPQVLLRFLF